MTAHARLARRLLAIALFAAPALHGCSSDETPTAPPGPDIITPLALDHAWPHADQQTYAYRFVVHYATPPPDHRYATAAEVPAVTLDQVAALLATPPPFTTVQETTRGYVLAFQDSAETGSGVRGQNLVPAITPYPIPSVLARDGVPFGATGEIEPDPPVFLGGGVWRQEPGRIALFTDLSTEPTWVFLAGALADRTAWEARVLPGVSDQVVIRGRAYQSVTVDIAGVRRDDALDVHYLLDHGIERLSLPGGGVEYRRRFSYARIVWASDAGPLYLYERRGLTAGNPPSPGVVESTLLLEQATEPAELAGGFRAPGGSASEPFTRRFAN
jgi:hypothetical protein